MSNYNPGDDIIDSRDIGDRLEELRDEHQDLVDNVEFAAELVESATESLSVDPDNAITKQELVKAKASLQEAEDAHQEWMDDNGEEFETLQEFNDECEGLSADWPYGETLIHESYWTEYCEDMARECADLPRDLPSWIEIDWEKTAENLAVDYTTVELDGHTYYIRSC